MVSRTCPLLVQIVLTCCWANLLQLTTTFGWKTLAQINNGASNYCHDIIRQVNSGVPTYLSIIKHCLNKYIVKGRDGRWVKSSYFNLIRVCSCSYTETWGLRVKATFFLRMCQIDYIWWHKWVTVACNNACDCDDGFQCVCNWDWSDKIMINLCASKFAW